MSVTDKDHAPPRCNCLALRQAARRVTQFYDAALAPTGIRGTQLPILHHLAEHGPMTMKALAEAMVLDRATLGHNLRPLEIHGLVERTVGADRRARLVTLTRFGRERLDAARGLWLEAQRTFESAFGSADAAALRASLARVAALELPVVRGAP